MKLSDQWKTPQWLFDELNEKFNFDIDLCASKKNSRCNTYCIDYLNNQAELGDFQEAISPLHKEFHAPQIRSAFMNPPYSNPLPFIEKAWEDSKHCKIVCLVKCDPSTKWWATFWDYNKNTPKSGCQVSFFPKRIKFEPPEGLSDKSGPTFPCALVIMDRQNV